MEEGEGSDASAQADNIIQPPPQYSGGVAEAGATVASPLSAKVLLVNREHAFLIIDAGKNSGVKAGEIFDVFHNDEFIGKVAVEKVHDTLSAANFLANFNAELASASDVVKRTQ